MDWEIFAQCRDNALQTFAANPAAPAGPYYVALKRKHIFDDILPPKEQPKFFAFSLTSPAVETAPVVAFVRKGTPFALRVDALYEFSNIYAPVLELTHRDGRIEITGILRDNWRRNGSAVISKNK